MLEVRDSFSRAWDRTTRKDAASVWSALERAYGERHRAYHNLDHIRDCFEQLVASSIAPQEPDALVVAIAFHDAVYSTRSATNEADSAAWARRSLEECGADGSTVASVESLILATRHPSRPERPDERLLVDIDLSILGREPPVFKRYEEAIRREYRWVPSFVYRRKRAEILIAFLQQKEIFSTDYFRDLYERQARENLTQSLTALGVAAR